MEGQRYFSTPPLDIVEHLADANHHGPRRVFPPLYIGFHATVGTNSLEWLSRTPGSNASVNRLITKAGVNYKIVPDELQPWTNGPSQMFTKPGSRANQLSAYLTIEFENLNTGHDPYPNPQLVMGAKQVLEWRGFYGDLPILSHWQVQANKTDPYGFPWEQFYHILFTLYRNVLSRGTWTSAL